MMETFKLHNYLSQKEFDDLKAEYAAFNASCKKSMIFHVGTGAGLYSELGSLLECIMYCYVNKIRFVMYADDANFAGGHGWNAFFEDFGDESHNQLNKEYNYRYAKYFRVGRLALPNLLFRRLIMPTILKKQERVDYLTQDLFAEIISDKFHKQFIDWPIFNIHGSLSAEYSKLSSLCLRYTEETYQDIQKMIADLNMPDDYVSIQIRGGDKTAEFTDIVGADYCIQKIEECVGQVTNLFVFTDDYRNIEYIREKRPDWNVFTLAREDERGYYNDKFNKETWEIKRANLIKLFAMVELCIHSKHHIGCDGACVNLFIRSCRNGMAYDDYQIGNHRPNTIQNKIKRMVQI